MLWPEDGAQRKNHLLRHYLEFQAWVDEECPDLRSNPLMLRMLDFQRGALGGWEALMELPPRREVRAMAEQRATQGTMAGMALLWMYWLHKNHEAEVEGGLSLNKVWSLLEREGEGMFGRPVTKDQLDLAWTKFKPVAHLWAAATYLDRWEVQEAVGAGHRNEPREDRDPAARAFFQAQEDADREVRHLLATAEEFQRFGLDFKPKHGRKTLLDRDSMFLLEDVPDWRIGLPNVRFDPELIEKLNDYQVR